MIIIFLELFLITVFGFFFLYLAALSVLALFARRYTDTAATTLRRFAIVVPAHDEELSIRKTVLSILAVDYPEDRFDLIVVADNCTDRTAEIAASSGATVLERSNAGQRGKGYALRWCFDQLLNRHPGYDAIAVIDADTVISRNFLSVLNFYIGKGSESIQVSDMVEPQPDAWSSEVTRLGFTLYNLVRPLGRKVIGCTAGIRGNGICFTTEILRKIPWDTYSLNEDLEYGLVLLLRGINVDFAPETTVYATMPTNARNAESQRSRWEKGRIPVIRQYRKILLLKAVRTLSLRYFDAFVELILPPFVNLFGIVLLLFLGTGILSLAGYEKMTLFLLLWGIVIVLGIGHVLIGLYAARADRMLLRAFFSIPKYVLWKFMLYLKISGDRPGKDWIRTTRDHPPVGDDKP